MIGVGKEVIEMDTERILENAFVGCLFAAATVLSVFAGGHHWAVPLAMLSVSIWMFVTPHKETSRLVCAIILLLYAVCFAVAAEQLDGMRLSIGAVVFSSPRYAWPPTLTRTP